MCIRDSFNHASRDTFASRASPPALAVEYAANRAASSASRRSRADAAPSFTSGADNTFLAGLRFDFTRTESSWACFFDRRQTDAFSARCRGAQGHASNEKSSHDPRGNALHSPRHDAGKVRFQLSFSRTMFLMLRTDELGPFPRPK